MELIIEKINSGFHAHCFIKINGRKINALIDTGASQTFVDKKFCQDIQIQLTNSDCGYTTLGEAENDTMVGKADIEIDGIEIPGMKFLVGSIEPVNSAYLKFGINHILCIIGMDILNNFVAVINMREKKILFDIK